MQALANGEKLSKEAVDYGTGTAAEHCGPVLQWKNGDCDHYQYGGRCEIVRGSISPRGWCKEWKAH